MDQLLLRKLNFSKAVEEKKGMVFCLWKDFRKKNSKIGWNERIVFFIFFIINKPFSSENIEVKVHKANRYGFNYRNQNYIVAP
jgi:hypothetical protein